MTIPPKEEAVPSPSQDYSARFRDDGRARRSGWEIAARPNNGPALWVKVCERLNESRRLFTMDEVLRIISHIDDCTEYGKAA